MEIAKMIKDYPTESVVVIAAFFSMIGWIGNNILQLIVDRNKQKKELKTFLWKEKINAAKKASEFYLEYLNFFNLVLNQLDLLESGKVENEQVAENINAEIQLLSGKLKAFPHFEYHHINIFYDFLESRASILSKQNFEILGKIYGLDSLKITPEEFNVKLKMYILEFNKNFTELSDIYKGFIKQVRNDINNYL